MILTIFSLEAPAETKVPVRVTISSTIGSKPGRYTGKIVQFLERRVRAPVDQSQASKDAALSAIRFQCLETGGNPNYMGFEEIMEVDQSLETVAGVIAKISSYAKLFPGYKSVELKSRTGNSNPPYLGFWKTAWEQVVPFPFVSNIRYEMDYVVVQPGPTQLVYRYQLASSDGTLLESDGAIVLQKLGPNRTRYSEWDFYDAKWGVGASIGRKRLWNKNLEGLLISDVAIAEQAKHLDWKPEKALEEAESVIDQLAGGTDCKTWVSADRLLEK